MFGNDREQYYFNYAYASYITGNSKQAKRYLQGLKTLICMENKQYIILDIWLIKEMIKDTAEAFFNQIKDNNNYKDKLIYFQADLNFKKGRFELAIDLAKSQLDTKK